MCIIWNRWRIQNGRGNLAKSRVITSAGLIQIANQIFYSINDLEYVGLNAWIIDSYF